MLPSSVVNIQYAGTFYANSMVTGTLVHYRNRPAKSHQAVHPDWHMVMQAELTLVIHTIQLTMEHIMAACITTIVAHMQATAAVSPTPAYCTHTLSAAVASPQEDLMLHNATTTNIV